MLDAIILAGGLGTRLKSVVSDLPKPMAPVAGHPFLETLLDSLADNGFRRVILSVGYMSEKIESHFGNEYQGVEIVYSHETQPMGTGGAIRLAVDHVLSDHVFIFNGDTFVEFDVTAAERMWVEESHHVVIGATVEDTTRYGRMLTSDSKVTGFQEKGVPGKGLINAGCYIVDVDALGQLPVGEKFSFEEVFLARAVEDEQLITFKTNGLFIDIGVPEDYQNAQEIFSR